MVDKAVKKLNKEFGKKLDEVVNGIARGNQTQLKRATGPLNTFIQKLTVDDDAPEPLKVALANLKDTSSSTLQQVTSVPHYFKVRQEVQDNIRKEQKDGNNISFERLERETKFRLTDRYASPLYDAFQNYYIKLKNFTEEKEVQAGQRQSPVLKRYNAHIEAPSQHPSQTKVDASKITRPNPSVIDHSLNQHESQRPVQADLPLNKVSSLKGGWEERIRKEQREAQQNSVPGR